MPGLMSAGVTWREQSMMITVDDAVDAVYHHFPSVSMDEARSIIYAVPVVDTKEIKYYDEDEKVWKIGRVIVDE